MLRMPTGRVPLRAAYLLLPLAWLACAGTLLRIDIEESATTLVEKGTLLENLASDFGFDAFTALDITASETLANQGVQPGDIAEARMTVFTLSATSPAQADLSFLRELSFYVEAPGLPRARIATQSTFPAGTASIDMVLDDVDLTDYIVSEEMTITTEAEGNRPDDDTTLEATFVLNVGVTGQGACNYLKGDG